MSYNISKPLVYCPKYYCEYPHYIEYESEGIDTLIYSRSLGCDQEDSSIECINCKESTYRDWLNNWNRDNSNNV